MSAITPDQFAEAVRAVSLSCFVGSFMACYFGAMFGSLTGRGILLFVRRRCRTWRRFSRAFDRTVWGAR